jgi:hypothetical protein
MQWQRSSVEAHLTLVWETAIEMQLLLRQDGAQ